MTQTLHSLELTYQYHLQQLTWFDLGSCGRYSPSSDSHDQSWPPQINFVYMPIPSMYGMFAYIWSILMVNLGKYTIVPCRCYGINEHCLTIPKKQCFRSSASFVVRAPRIKKNPTPRSRKEKKVMKFSLHKLNEWNPCFLDGFQIKKSRNLQGAFFKGTHVEL